MSTQSASAATAGRTVNGSLAAVAGGVAAGLAVWLVAHQLGGVDLAVRTGSTVQNVGWVAVAVMSLVAGLAGWALLAVVRRFTKNPRRIWTLIAVPVLLVSLLGPLGGVDAADKVGLAALHVVVGAVLIVAMRRASR